MILNSTVHKYRLDFWHQSLNWQFRTFENIILAYALCSESLKKLKFWNLHIRYIFSINQTDFFSKLLREFLSRFLPTVFLVARWSVCRICSLDWESSCGRKVRYVVVCKILKRIFIHNYLMDFHYLVWLGRFIVLDRSSFYLALGTLFRNLEKFSRLKQY